MTVTGGFYRDRMDHDNRIRTRLAIHSPGAFRRPAAAFLVAAV